MPWQVIHSTLTLGPLRRSHESLFRFRFGRFAFGPLGRLFGTFGNLAFWVVEDFVCILTKVKRRVRDTNVRWETENALSSQTNTNVLLLLVI